MLLRLRHYLKTEKGATAIEYALIAGGIFVAIAAVFFLAGDSTLELYQRISDLVANAVAQRS